MFGIIYALKFIMYWSKFLPNTASLIWHCSQRRRRTVAVCVARTRRRNGCHTMRSRRSPCRPQTMMPPCCVARPWTLVVSDNHRLHIIHINILLYVRYLLAFTSNSSIRLYFSTYRDCCKTILEVEILRPVTDGRFYHV